LLVDFNQEEYKKKQIDADLSLMPADFVGASHLAITADLIEQASAAKVASIFAANCG